MQDFTICWIKRGYLCRSTARSIQDVHIGINCQQRWLTRKMCGTDYAISASSDYRHLTHGGLRDIEKASILAEQNCMWITRYRNCFHYFCLAYVDHTDTCGCSCHICQIRRSTVGIRM